MTAPDRPPADRNGSDMGFANPARAHTEVEYRDRTFPNDADPDVACPSSASQTTVDRGGTDRPHDRAYATSLRSMGARLLEQLDGPEAADPPDGDRGRILPMIGGILQGRQAHRDKDPASVAERFASGILHLALIAFSDGDPHLRILDFLREQRRRYDAGRGRHHPAWWECPAKHHFERLIANALSLTHEIDAREPSEERKRLHAADAANYALFLLHVSGVPLSDRPHPTTPLRQESPAP